MTHRTKQYLLVVLIFLLGYLILCAGFCNQAFAGGKKSSSDDLVKPDAEFSGTGQAKTTGTGSNTAINQIKSEDISQLGNQLTAFGALSSIPSLTCNTVSCTGIGAAIAGTDENTAGSIAVEHEQGRLKFRAGVGASEGEHVYGLGMMGRFR